MSNATDTSALHGDGADRPIGVLIVDDHAVVRRGMRAFFDMLPDIVVVGEASDGAAALGELTLLNATGQLPDVVIMDLMMPRLGGVEAIRALKQQFAAVHVIAMTSFGEAERVRAALAAGASGYLLKDAAADEVAAAVRASFRGELHLDAAVTRTLTASLIQQRNDPAALTMREREVVVRVAQGLSNKQIAQALLISERTARTHVSNILVKLELSSRTQLALWAIQRGLITAS